MPTLNRLLASNVRRLRNERGISQERLGELADLDRTYVGAIERGESNVTLEVVEAFSRALDVNPLDLLTDGPAS